MLPTEIVDFIADQWPGRGLYLTCRRLAERANIDRFIVETSIYTDYNGRSVNSKSDEAIFLINISKLPNGIFHGANRIKHCDAGESDVIYYNLGKIVHIDNENDDVLNRREICVGGYACSWYNDDSQTEMIISCADRIIKEISGVKLDDFERVTTEWIKSSGLAEGPGEEWTSRFGLSGSIFPGID